MGCTRVVLLTQAHNKVFDIHPHTLTQAPSCSCSNFLLKDTLTWRQEELGKLETLRLVDTLFNLLGSTMTRQVGPGFEPIGGL